MKRIIIFILILFTILPVYSQNTKWKALNDLDVYEISWDGINYFKNGSKILSGTDVLGIDSMVYTSKTEKMEMVNINKEYMYFVDINSLVPTNSTDLFDSKLLKPCLRKNNFEIIPYSYFLALNQKNRDYLCTLEKEGYKNYQKTKTDMDNEWYESRAYYNESSIYNVSINLINVFSSYYFMVQSINRKSNQYFVTAEVTYFREFEKKKYSIPKIHDVIELIITIDGDYLIVEYQEDILGSFVISDKKTSEQIDKFIRNNNCDYSQITWPRHADGTSDFDKEIKPPMVELVKNTEVKEEKILKSVSIAPSTNVTVNKLMSVTENLKLRSGEATTTSVLTIMQAGTKVKILELGKEETIDGINSNWVKVEVISGRDRDGKDIKKKTTGWCYGGYLE